MKNLQLVCPPITVRPVRDNLATIHRGDVLVAEIDHVYVGYCLSHLGRDASDPLFIQVVAVAPEARGRGVGQALLGSAAERAPLRDIALATRDDNVAARAMNERFAESLDASIRRVPLTTFRLRDLGISRGLGYRAWEIRRPAR
ncbi:GNAT family N-acetyltransferase [Microbacterium oxydans]|uniref:GNAT family N-acetyltransferase n=1 Tax=Microbacterium oxydans TaxID=82380 RepID=UPI003B009770